MLHIAVEPAADQIAPSARRAERERLENALFVQAAIETLPEELVATADRIAILYPWGSLLKAVAAPDLALVKRIAALGRDGAALTMLVNMSVFDDPAYCVRIGLPHPPVLADAVATRRLYADAGLVVRRCQPVVGDPPFRTTWGQKLIRGSQRKVLLIEAEVTASR